MIEGPLFTYFLFFVVVVLLAVILYYRYKSYSKSKATKNRFARGRLLENQARDFLIQKGYKILDEQKQFEHKYFINNDRKLSTLIIDYYVSKNGKKYIVEVKSGQSAISASNTNTRRQLLEYSFAIPNDGVFLLDMENQKLELIEFINSTDLSLSYLLKGILIITFFGIFIPFWKLKIALVLFLGILFFLKPLQLRNISEKINSFINKR